MWWSWVLTAVGVTGFFLAGRKVWWAWYVNIANQVLWTAYAIVTQQWGFLAAVFIYLAVFIPNAVRWTKEHREKKLIERDPFASCARPGCGKDVADAVHIIQNGHLYEFPSQEKQGS